MDLKNFIVNILKIILQNKFIFRLISKLKIILDNNIYNVSYKNLNLRFYNNSWITNFRYKTFANKEPETLEWINTFKNNSIFWDIGANVGLYSVFAGKLGKKIKVYAFEPSPFNYEILVKNFEINKLNDAIIIPIPLSNKIQIAKFKLSNTITGGALSVFGEEYDANGNIFSEELSFNTLGINIDEICNIFNLQKPDYIKVDVDGIEHLILEGGEKIIKNCQSILIEINKNFPEQKEKCNNFLEKNGFKKTNLDLIGFESTNELWTKK